MDMRPLLRFLKRIFIHTHRYDSKHFARPQLIAGRYYYCLYCKCGESATYRASDQLDRQMRFEDVMAQELGLTNAM